MVPKVIMSGEAAARPQKLQKLRQVVHGLDKSAGDGKVPTTRLNGVFVLASDDLDSDSRTVSLRGLVGRMVLRNRSGGLVS